VRWRHWLIDVPARITDVLLVWYRLYMVVVLSIAAILLPVSVMAMLVLWFGFGIRWGW
jgi:hypothetical protein